MAKVHGYIARHMAQKPEHPKILIGLFAKNWGMIILKIIAGTYYLSISYIYSLCQI